MKFIIPKPFYSSHHDIVSICLILVATSVVQSVHHHQSVNIIRGSKDKFANIAYHDGIRKKFSNCDAFGQANCLSSDCDTCECSGSDLTFTLESGIAGGSYGRCIPNKRFVSSIDENNSFRVYKKSHAACMHPTDLISIEATPTCDDLTDTMKYWIWTKYNQLLNLGTLKCLQMSETSSFIGEIPYPNLFLDTCNASEVKQLWECEKGTYLFKNKYSTSYMNFGNTFSYQVILYQGTGSFSLWWRYQSATNQHTTLCSHVSSYIGCYKYSDGDAMFKIASSDIDECRNYSNRCSKQKTIQAPIESTNNQCSIQWDMTQFLNYTTWDFFPLKLEEIFTIDKTYDGIQLVLKVDLTKISLEFRGQILKLYIRCVNSSHQTASLELSEKNGGETHCALVKIAGKFNVLYSGVITEPSSLIPVTTTAPVSSNEKNTGSSGSATVIAVAVSLVVVCLVIGSILAYIFYKRRAQKKDDSEISINAGAGDPLSANAAESLNPIYNTDELDGRSECQLYEPGDEPVYHYAEPDISSKSRDNTQEVTYDDYATPDDVTDMARPRQQSPARYEDCVSKKEGSPSNN